MGFLGEIGIKKRNAWSKYVQKKVIDPKEPNWIDAFSRFRFLVDRHLNGDRAGSGSTVDDLHLYVEIAADNNLRYVLHDTRTLEAAPVTDVSALLTIEMQTTIDQIKTAIAATAQTDRPDPVSTHLAFDRTALGTYAWRPEAELFPDLQMYPATATSRPADL